MVSQHRRGGRHAVKDEDLTHTKYDEYDREQLLAAVKEAGCYVKDDKKSVMARKLAAHDRDLRRQESKAIQERKEREARQRREIEDAAAARTARRRDRTKRNQERSKRRDREQEEDVSTDSDNTEDFDERDRNDAHKLTVTGGEALSDDTWDDTCSETSVYSVNPRIAPDFRLQLFEWPYTTMPSPHPPEDPRFERFPSAITYTPLKLVTTSTREKVSLPGLKYPPNMEPDFVPIPDALTRAAARHGHKIGVFANAFIEKATSWAERTIVSGWNGRMYFSMPQNSAKNVDLQSVYQKRNTEDSRLLKPTPGATDIRADRQQRRALRLANRRKKTAEVYEASTWRPLALGYMPAYLDWRYEVDNNSSSEEDHTTENLYYIRFSDSDLPHYYFWTKAGEWSDPTTPDPSWSSKVLDSQNSALKSNKLKVKKLTAPPQRRDDTGSHQPTLESIEHDLIIYGLSATFAKCRSLMVANAKERTWRAFTRSLPFLYPSGILPFAPPLECMQDMCLAKKLFKLLSGGEPLSFTGQECWTRDDDAIWEVRSHVEDDSASSSTDSDTKRPEHANHTSLLDSAQNEEEHSKTTQALHRRNSTTPPHPKSHHIWTWLTNISTTPTPYLAPSAPIMNTLPSPISPLNLTHTDPPPTCPFCSTPWLHHTPSQRATHMLSHSAPTLANGAFSPATSNVEATGVGVKRRHSLLSARTLQSYHEGRKGKRVRIESVGGWCGWGAGTSPFSREVERARRVRGSRGWIGWGGVGKEVSAWDGDDDM